jgi:transcriptional regulator with GAF, ATPase, and Fis domain
VTLTSTSSPEGASVGSTAAAQLARERPTSRSVSGVDAAATAARRRPPLEAVIDAGLHAVPRAQHASVAALERGGAMHVVAANSELAQWLCRIQSDLGQGPSCSALRGDRPTAVLRTADETANHWPRLAELLSGRGVQSVLACRLVWHDGVVGVLTIASEDAGAFCDKDIAAANAYAGHAAATVALAREVEQLQLALVTRQEIGQAVGILMERYRLTPDAAFAYLRRLSQDGNTKLRDIAELLRLTGRLPGQ